jgi:nucleotide-binding universal stress UspA family protein
MTTETVPTTTATDTSRERRIVAGTDGSSASLRALDWAAVQAELTGATLEIVAVWEWPNSFGWGSIPEGFDPARDAHDIVAPTIATLQQRHPQLVIDLRIAQGLPAPELVSASKGAELLVVGSRGHGEFVGMLIGSTSEHCVANADCTVVVVRGADV